MSQIYEYPITGKVQGDGNQTIDKSVVSELANATRHQVTIIPEGATGGSVAVLVKPYGASAYEALTINGTAVSISIASPKTYVFEGNIDAIRFVPTSVTGGDGTYGAAVSGWK